MDSGFQVLFSVTLIIDSIIGGIPDSLIWILDSKAQDSGLHKQNFHGFRDSTSKYLLDSPTLGENNFDVTSIDDWNGVDFNVRTYTQINTPTLGVDGVFDMLQYFETTLPLVESL